jgi:hypothetical protein
MSVALLIASLSLGQFKIIPKPIRSFPLLALPPLIVLMAMAYWLWRVRARPRSRGIAAVSAPEAV